MVIMFHVQRLIIEKEKVREGKANFRFSYETY